MEIVIRCKVFTYITPSLLVDVDTGRRSGVGKPEKLTNGELLLLHGEELSSLNAHELIS